MKKEYEAIYNEVVSNCQCTFPIIRNGKDVLMNIFDSECEFYFEDYDIQQEVLNDSTYNVVDLEKLYNQRNSI